MTCVYKEYEVKISLKLNQMIFQTVTFENGDIIYDQPQNESFCNKLESVQYKAALAITGAIQGTSRDKLYQELGLESLKSRRWYKHLSYMSMSCKLLII